MTSAPPPASVPVLNPAAIPTALPTPLPTPFPTATRTPFPTATRTPFPTASPTPFIFRTPTPFVMPAVALITTPTPTFPAVAPTVFPTSTPTPFVTPTPTRFAIATPLPLRPSMSYATTASGSPKEVYLDITVSAGTNVTATLNGPGILSSAQQSAVATGGGQVRLTWSINVAGNYSASGSAGATSFNSSVVVQ